MLEGKFSFQTSLQVTTFGRSGHYRTNQNGTTFCVEEHSVTRDDWPAGVPRPVQRAYTVEDAVSPARNITIPNARCPGCGDPVFFFIAANGGRVFFEHLGKPWPKHDCGLLSCSNIPAFSDDYGISQWQADRRSLHGSHAVNGMLALTPGYASGTARIVRRSSGVIALVETDAGKRAFIVDSAWPGRAERTVYFGRTNPPNLPEALDYLDADLCPVSVKVISAADLPTTARLADVSAVAEGAMPDVEEWTRSCLKGFRAGPRLKLDRRVVGLTGYLGRSRIVILPLAPWFDVQRDEIADSKTAQSRLSEAQLKSWAPRLTKMLDRSEATRSHPLYWDLFVWLAPAFANTYELERVADRMTRPHDWAHSAHDLAEVTERLPAVHIIEEIDHSGFFGIELDDAIRETKHNCALLLSMERGHLAACARQTTEKKWLEAWLRRSGLDMVMGELKRDGVDFTFGSTIADSLHEWGLQAILPDGRSLLVLLHLSTPALGLAFAHFSSGTFIEEEADEYEPEAMFYGNG